MRRLLSQTWFRVALVLAALPASLARATTETNDFLGGALAGDSAKWGVEDTLGKLSP